MQNPQDIMTQMILAQITDLQRRITNQDAVIASLKDEIASLRTTAPSVAPRATPHTIAPPPPLPVTPFPTTVAPGQQQRHLRKRPGIAPIPPATATGEGQKEQKPQWNLSTLLNENEEVTFSVGLGRDDRGMHSQFTTLSSTFDGKEFLVTSAVEECTKELIGMRSDKPGAILFKFIELLHTNSIIPEKFSVAPWKLCSVIRGGKRLTLEYLAKQNQAILG